MKNNIYKIIFCALAVITLSGCIKETFPKGSTLTEEQLTQTDEALTYMLSGIPSAMTKTGAGGFYANYGLHNDFGLPAIQLALESMLEDIAISNTGYYQFTPYYQNIYQGSDYAWAQFFWNQYYKWIKLTNDIINIGGEVTDETSDKVKQVLGQAHAYRAMYYLDLARMYEPKPNAILPPSESIISLTVPIVTEKTTETDATNNPRASREEMYQFIISDLETATEYLKNSSLNYTSPGLAAVYGMLARAYIELGAAYKEQNKRTEWDEMTSQIAYEKAAEYARKVIDMGRYSPLTQAQWEDATNGFNNGATNNAWIWGVSISSENVNNLIANVSYRSNEALFGYAQFFGLSVNRALYDKIPNEDFRKHSWWDPDLGYNYQFAGGSTLTTYMGSTYLISPTGYIGGSALEKYKSLKFRPAQGDIIDYTTGNAANWCLMRIEEMYFIEIEAQFNLSGGLAKAQQLLNEFMQNYRYPEYDCTYRTMTQEAFIEELMLQKRIEFWGEGILFFDYKRLNRGITRGYANTNIPAQARFNCEGRSPQWNIVIVRNECQSNKGIRHPQDNNPDPSEKLVLWK